MKLIDEDMGEILVVRNEARISIELHIRGTNPEGHRSVRLARHEARRLAALLLYQSEKLGQVRLVPAADLREIGVKRA